MRKVGTDIQAMLANMGASSDAARVNMRIQQVRDRYRQAIESVYRKSAELHLAHTNNVIIKDRTLVVYVDDSLFAAELNAQRELVRLRLLELFGEEVDDFQIRTSMWRKYRDQHPYLAEEAGAPRAAAPAVSLDSDEESYVTDVSATIENERVRRAFEKAMTADMEWKKGERVENEGEIGNRAL